MSVAKKQVSAHAVIDSSNKTAHDKFVQDLNKEFDSVKFMGDGHPPPEFGGPDITDLDFDTTGDDQERSMENFMAYLKKQHPEVLKSYTITF